MDLVLAITSLAAPLQIEGIVGDHAVYYRGRHGAYRIEVDGIPVTGGTSEMVGHVKFAMLRILDATHSYMTDSHVRRTDAEWNSHASNMLPDSTYNSTESAERDRPGTAVTPS